MGARRGVLVEARRGKEAAAGCLAASTREDTRRGCDGAGALAGVDVLVVVLLTGAAVVLATKDGRLDTALAGVDERVPRRPTVLLRVLLRAESPPLVRLEAVPSMRIGSKSGFTTVPMRAVLRGGCKSGRPRRRRAARDLVNHDTPFQMPTSKPPHVRTDAITMATRATGWSGAVNDTHSVCSQCSTEDGVDADCVTVDPSSTHSLVTLDGTRM